MSIYERFGVRTRINAAGLLTRLGGSLMPVEVLDAMTEAAGSFVDMAELQAAASARDCSAHGRRGWAGDGGGRGRAHGRDGGMPRRTGSRAHGPTPRDGRFPERGCDVSDAPDRLRPCHSRGGRPDPRGGVQRPGDRRRRAGRGGVGAGGGHHAAYGGHRLHGRTGESTPPCGSGRPGAPPSSAGLGGRRRPVAAGGEPPPLRGGGRRPGCLQRGKGDPGSAGDRHSLRSAGPRRVRGAPAARPGCSA